MVPSRLVEALKLTGHVERKMVIKIFLDAESTSAGVVRDVRHLIRTQSRGNDSYFREKEGYSLRDLAFEGGSCQPFTRNSHRVLQTSSTTFLPYSMNDGAVCAFLNSSVH